VAETSNAGCRSADAGDRKAALSGILGPLDQEVEAFDDKGHRKMWPGQATICLNASHQRDVRGVGDRPRHGN